MTNLKKELCEFLESLSNPPKYTITAILKPVELEGERTFYYTSKSFGKTKSAGFGYQIDFERNIDLSSFFFLVKEDFACDCDYESYVDERVKTPVPLGAKFTDTIVDVSAKADKSYVDDRVKTPVPAGAKFTDTIVDITGKADKTYVDAQVKTPVPAGAKFTDTIVDISAKADINYVNNQDIKTFDFVPNSSNIILLDDTDFFYSPALPQLYGKTLLFVLQDGVSYYHTHMTVRLIDGALYLGKMFSPDNVNNPVRIFYK